MTALKWFTAYRDAVETAHLLMQCQTNTQAKAFYCRTLAAYDAAKGGEYADSVARQVSLILAGVDALRRETT